MVSDDIYCAGEAAAFPERLFRREGERWVHLADPDHWADTGFPLEDDDGWELEEEEEE